MAKSYLGEFAKSTRIDAGVSHELFARTSKRLAVVGAFGMIVNIGNRAIRICPEILW